MEPAKHQYTVNFTGVAMEDVSIRLYRWNKQEDRWENASRTVSCQLYFYSYIKKAGQEEPVNREAGKFFNDTKIKLVLL